MQLAEVPHRLLLPRTPLQRSRIRVPAKKRSWASTLIRNRGVLLGYVDAPNEKAAELAAAKAFTLNK